MSGMVGKVSSTGTVSKMVGTTARHFKEFGNLRTDRSIISPRCLHRARASAERAAAEVRVPLL
jgi:hypothetical protein